MRVVSVRAVDDSLAQGLHFSRITQGIDAADAANLYGLTAADVAAGIAAAVNGDSSGRFHADVSGSTVTVNGPAFTGTVTAGGGTLTIDSSASTPALTGTTTFTLSGSVTVGEIWKLTLNGVDFAYGAQQGDGLAEIATALASSVSSGGSFTATANGTTLTVTPIGSAPYTAVLTTSSASSPIAATTFTPATCPASAPQTCEWSSLVLHVSIAGQVQPQQAWALSLNTGTSAASAVTYTYVAGQNGETTLLAPLTAKVADNNAPGVLVLQPTGSTNLIEPSQFVVLGDGFVSSFLSSCPVTGSTAVTCFTGDFGTSTVNESGFHATLASAQNLELASWGLNADPNIVNATTIPHVTVHGTGDGNSDFYKFTVTQAMLDASGGAVQTTFDIDHGYTAGDPIVWLSKLRLYNQAGNLVAQGPGYSNPYTQGAGGSTTWFDDFLQTSLSAPGNVHGRGRQLALHDRPAVRRQLRPPGLRPAARGRRLRLRARPRPGERDRQQHDPAERRQRGELVHVLQLGRRRPGRDDGRLDQLEHAVRPDRRLGRRLVRPLLVHRLAGDAEPAGGHDRHDRLDDGAGAVLHERRAHAERHGQHR